MASFFLPFAVVIDAPMYIDDQRCSASENWSHYSLGYHSTDVMIHAAVVIFYQRVADKYTMKMARKRKWRSNVRAIELIRRKISRMMLRRK